MSGRLKKLTVEQVSESVKMYEQGLSLQIIGNYFTVSRQAMWSLLRCRIQLRDKRRYGESNNFYTGTKANGKAQNILEYALLKGIIKRPGQCSKCGKECKFKNGRDGIQAHHSDYNKPLDVMWLCQKCHHEWHKINKAVAFKGKIKQ